MLKVDDVYPELKSGRAPSERQPSAPITWQFTPEVLFDTLEYLHAEGVSEPDESSVVFLQKNGQESLRKRLNPDLALFAPPMEMLDNGQIVEKVPDETHALLTEPIPEDVPRALADPLEHAIAQYLRRGATDQEKRAAVTQVAAVLEPLRADVKEHLSTKDEKDLFQIINRFSIRHNKPDQQRDYDADMWLDWMFIVNVATARALIAVIDRDKLKERVAPRVGRDDVPF